jgi:nitroreductase
MDAISAITQRTSVQRFRPDPLSRDLIQQVLDCAVRAPNHKLTEPWRFSVLTGAARDRFADVRANHLVVMMAQNPDEIIREEDYGATMMAIANLMTAAQSLGLGTSLKTGGVMRDPSLLKLARTPEHFRVVGIVSLGYPAQQETPRRRKPASELTQWIE